LQVRRLAESTQSLFRWFDADRRTTYPALVKVIDPTHYEKAIITAIDEVLDESGTVRDNASEELAKIRMKIPSLRRPVGASVLAGICGAGLVDRFRLGKFC